MRAFLVIALGAVLVLPLTASALPDETWVLAIGHNVGAQGEVGLLYAEQDARAIVDALREHGRVSARRMTLMLGENAASVRGALQDVNAKIRSRAGEGKHTALIVFYSGHADASALHLGGTEPPLEAAELRPKNASTLNSLAWFYVGTGERLSGWLASQRVRSITESIPTTISSFVTTGM
jgi:hypothetical protein